MWVTSIQTGKSQICRFFLYTSDDDRSIKIPYSAAIELALPQEPWEISEGDWNQLETSAQVHWCLAHGRYLCNRAEQNTSALVSKLSQRGYSKDAIAQAMELLVEEGLVDDWRFCQRWLGAAPPHKSPLQRTRGLVNRGITLTMAKEAVDLDQRKNEPWVMIALNFWLKKSQEKGIDSKNLLFFLKKHRFSSELLKKHREKLEIYDEK